VAIDDVTTAAGHDGSDRPHARADVLRERIATTPSALDHRRSGTGKEIWARAIHTYSIARRSPSSRSTASGHPTRDARSQLFATAAERLPEPTAKPRHHPKRRDGTLFLDEIGELGLDSPAEALRFLESARSVRLASRLRSRSTCASSPPPLQTSKLE